MNLEGLRRPEGISSNIPDLMPLDFFFFKHSGFILLLLALI